MPQYSEYSVYCRRQEACEVEFASMRLDSTGYDINRLRQIKFYLSQTVDKQSLESSALRA